MVNKSWPVVTTLPLTSLEVILKQVRVDDHATAATFAVDKRPDVGRTI